MLTCTDKKNLTTPKLDSLFLFPELKKKKKIFDGKEATRERGESSLLLLGPSDRAACSMASPEGSKKVQ